MKVISKTKEKGNGFGTMKKIKKKNRLLEAKAHKERTENKRVNAENRKAREEKNEELDKAKNVRIVDFVKEMLLVEVEGKIEKRALLFDKRHVNKENFAERMPRFEVKLYGENHQLSTLKGYLEKHDDLLWKIEEIF
ncbi:MAG: hypothetical protein ACRC0V_04400 [Fusobacteriaceae bacterium]